MLVFEVMQVQMFLYYSNANASVLNYANASVLNYASI